MKHALSLGAATAALLLLLAPAVPAEEPAALVDGVLAAYGGWPALSSVKAYRMTGTVLPGHSRPPAPVVRTLVRPDRLPVVLGYADGRELRVLDGSRGWRGDAKLGTADVQGPMLDSMALQLARASLPWILAERRADLRSCEPGRMTGTEMPCLELALAEGLRLQAYVDPASHRVVRCITHLSRGGMTTNFDTRFSDFRPVDGVVFAFREENYAGGTHTASTAIEKVALNPAGTEAEFTR
jgi:hypothetical protein